MPRTKLKYAQVVRLLRMLDDLHGKPEGVRLRTFEKKFDITIKMVRRDIESLEQAGHRIQLRLDDERFSRAYLEEESYQDVPITRQERWLIENLADEVKKLYAGTPWEEHIDSLRDKFQQRLPAKQRDARVLRAKSFFVPHGGTKDYRRMGEIFDALDDGVHLGRVVKYSYRLRTGHLQRGFLAAYAYGRSKNTIYLAARPLKKVADAATPPPPGEALRTFKVECFVAAEAIPNTRIAVPENIAEQIEAVFGESFGMHAGGKRSPEQVIVEFSKAKASYVKERTYHRTQRREELRDGRVRLQMAVADTTELPSFILEWGPHAKASAPAALVDAVRMELRDALAQYVPELSLDQRVALVKGVLGGLRHDEQAAVIDALQQLAHQG